MPLKKLLQPAYSLVVGGSLLAGLFLVVTVSLFLWMGCDGGWYSYPGYAVDSGLGLFANRGALGDQLESQVDGVLCIFDFNTSSSIRVLFFRFWFGVFGAGIVSAKVFGLFEIALTITVFILIARKIRPSIGLLWLILVFLLNDKRLIIAGAGDLRPDISVTLYSGFLLLLFWNWHRKHILLRFLGATLLVLAHSSSIVPFGGVLVFGLFMHRQQLLVEKWRIVEIAALLVYSATIFLFQTDIMAMLLGGSYTSNMASSPVLDKILALWDKGLPAIAAKEIARWQKYFSRSNIVEGLVLVSCCLVYLDRIRRKDRIASYEKAAFVALAVCLFGYAILDPHIEQMHVYPMKIFYLIFIAASFHSMWQGRTLARMAVVILIVMNTGTSLIWSGRATLSDHGRTTITGVQAQLSEIFQDGDQYLVLGPTEIWPFVSDKRMIVEDNYRARPRSPEVRGILAISDFVVVNRDYRAYGWKKMLAEYPPEEVKLVKRINGYDDTIEVYRIEVPPQPAAVR